MTLSADIRDAWDAAVWQHVSIVEPVTVQQLKSTGLIDADVDELYYNTRLNFIQAITTTAQQIGITGSVPKIVTVEISYYVQIIENDQSFLEVIDRLEAIRELVYSELGTDWSGLVDYWQYQESPPDIVDLSIASVQCWRGREVYTGTILS